MRASKISDVQGNHAGWMIFCPGCDEYHIFDKRWTFNGDLEKPTFTPSYLSKTQDTVCHSFVTDGAIRYLGDCTHKLKGQTVDLPEKFSEA